MFAKYKDIFSGSFFFICAVLLFIGSFSIRNFSGASYLGPAFVPRLVALLLALLSGMVFLGGVRKAITANQKVTQEESKNKAVPASQTFHNTSVLFSIINLILYISLINFLGFILMTALYLSFQIYLLSDHDNRKTPFFIITGIVASGVIYLIFAKVFHLLLPPGILG